MPYFHFFYFYDCCFTQFSRIFYFYNHGQQYGGRKPGQLRGTPQLSTDCCGLPRQSRRAYSLVVSSVWLLKSLFIRRALEINVTKYVLWPQLKVLIINILLLVIFYHSSSKCQNINKETCCDRRLLKSETFFRLSWFFSFFLLKKFDVFVTSLHATSRRSWGNTFTISGDS